jgi:hypothetical protein
MNTDSHRVISISLNEQDWQAFVRIHPQPVLWLREHIQQAIAAGDAPIARSSAAGAASTTSATTR